MHIVLVTYLEVAVHRIHTALKYVILLVIFLLGDLTS